MSVLLIAEDDDDIATILTRIFRRAGLTALRAGDGTAALAMAVTSVPDVILTDLGMPGMDGWDLIAAVRGHTTLADTPLAVLSGHLQPNDPRVAASGCCAALLKPCPNDQLLTTVQKLVEAGPHRHAADVTGCPALHPLLL